MGGNDRADRPAVHGHPARHDPEEPHGRTIPVLVHQGRLVEHPWGIEKHLLEIGAVDVSICGRRAGEEDPAVEVDHLRDVAFLQRLSTAHASPPTWPPYSQR